MVLVDKILCPHALQRLVLHRFDDLLDNLWQVLVADRVVVARLLLLLGEQVGGRTPGRCRAVVEGAVRPCSALLAAPQALGGARLQRQKSDFFEET